MAHVMTKQGSLDNVITYEFICDALADMNAIENKYRTIGSVAIVLQGSGGLEVYMANSQKEWINLGIMDSNSSDDNNNNNNQNSAVSPTVDQGTADNMVLQE